MLFLSIHASSRYADLAYKSEIAFRVFVFFRFVIFIKVFEFDFENISSVFSTPFVFRYIDPENFDDKVLEGRKV